ncbi:unnamed protein product [Sphagnum jensenii]|uniref:Uncharacterized protein n=1 Tax=Sphagnum jensenii TaxID=128206 RepID=A0ABP1BCA5_9BRYO
MCLHWPTSSCHTSASSSPRYREECCCVGVVCGSTSSLATWLRSVWIVHSEEDKEEEEEEHGAMHDSRGSSSLMESENGRSSVFSSLEGSSNINGPTTSVYSLMEEGTTNAFLYNSERSAAFDHQEKVKTQQQQLHAKDRDAENSAPPSKNGTMAMGVRLSDTNMASRRAEQAANRRMLAASWLQEMVGITSLPNEPSEEEFRLCLRNGLILCNAINKVHPGAVPKVVEIPPLSNHLDGAQSAYQYFENVRNFLVAVEDMGLPSFEASDLEQGSLSPSSSAKLVDCILALKSYHEWKQGGALGFWRLKSPSHPMGYITNSGKYIIRSKSMNTSSSQGRRNSYITHDLSLSLKSFDIVLMQNAPSHSLLSLISAILGDKPPDEVPMLVEFMLRKVMEEFERHLLTQRKQVTKMKTTLKDLFVREEKSASQNLVLEALAAGSQEEVKLITKRLQQVKMEKKQVQEENRLKEEEVERLMKESEEKQMAVQVLKNELEYIKRLDEEHLLRLEKQKREIEVESKERIRTLELQLQDAQKKMHEIEMNTASELSILRLKDAKCQEFLSQHAQEYKNLRWAQYSAKEDVLRMQMEWKTQLSTLGNELQEMARAASGYHKVLAENRALYNEVQDLKGNIRVYCRVRPFLTDEPGRPTTVQYIGENGELVLGNPSKSGGKEPRRTFTFNKVFATTASQEEVFMDTQPLIRSVLDGYNVCIFAYGQTGSGKTFTMSGPNNMTQFNWGVNYRALHDLFHMTQSRLDVFHYEIGVQMLEIYNEQVRDLLNTDGVHRKYPFHISIRNKSQLNGLNVPDASMMPVRSTEDVLELMKVGQRNRAVGATALNERSSRSHSVLTVHVQGTDLGSGAVLRGSLHLVDLAGSERVDKSEATGDRLKEAQHINKSLSALGDVIAALAQKSGHVPYRNSKLTQLLQDSLGGQAKTLMFVHISPDVESFGETVSTLKFAERVSSVELGAARSNKESGEVQNLRDEVAQLRDAAAKKDAEIERLQALKDRTPAGESDLGIEKLKLKAFGGSPLARRISMEPAAVQRNRKQIMDAEVRHSMHKIPGLPKQPPLLVLSTSHDSEDAVENIVSSSACSPVESPTECKVSFDGPEEVAINMSDKLKLLKTRHGSLGQSLTAIDSDNVVHIIKPKSKQEESVLANHGEIIMHDKQYLLSILDTTLQIAPNASQPESVVEEWHDRFQKSGDESLSASQVYEKLPRSSTYLTGQDRAELGIAHSIAPIQSTSRLKPPLNGVFSSQQDDSGSLLSESGLSVETDLPSLGPVDQNKKLQSSSVQPRHERKALLQTQVPRPPIRSSSKISPLRSDRRSLGGQQQPRPRRYTNVAIAVSTDKPIAKRNVSLGGNSAPEGELNVSQDGGSENNSPYDAGLKPSLSRNMSGGKSSKRWI